MRYELTDYEWAAIKPFLPNKPRGTRAGIVMGGMLLQLIFEYNLQYLLR